MIIKESQLLGQFKDIDIKYQPVLLYGPNEGLIRHNKDRIKKTFTKNNILEISFTGKSINEKPDIFYDEVKTISMFEDKKIIVVEQPLDKNITLFENIFEELPDKTLIVIIGNNLSRSSKIRKFFENSQHYLSCAHYDDDLGTSSQLIKELEKSIKRVLDKDIKNYISQNLSNNRLISKNEIDKIILLYSNNNKEPKLEDIKSICNDNADLGLNKICQLVFSGNPKKVSIFLNKIFSEGVNPIAIIRTMLNYIQRIESTQIALKKTNNFDLAIKGLKPPVFWKEKDLFQLHCMKWPINETISNFNLLVEAELSCKNDYYLTNIICERALINIAARGRKYFS